MIYRHVLETLTDEEKGIVLYVVNYLFPLGGMKEIDMNTITAVKLPALHHKLTCAANQVKPEYIEQYKIMCSKLELTLIKEKNET
jgi:hypothetical protein